MHTGYAIVAGTPSISNDTYLAGNPASAWTQKFPPLQNGGSTSYATLKSGSAGQDKIRVTQGGFAPGFEYTLTYRVLSSKTASSTFGTSALVQIASVEAFPILITSKTTNFTQNVNTNQWVAEFVTFTAKTETIDFTFSGGVPAGGMAGFVNFHVAWKLTCQNSLPPVTLEENYDETPFPLKTKNLNQVITSPTPPGAVIAWIKHFPGGFNSDEILSPSEQENALPSQVLNADMQYEYQVHYENHIVTPNDNYTCYNPTNPPVKFEYFHKPKQVQLLTNTTSVNCINASAVDLTAQQAPSAFEVRWFENKNHQGYHLDDPIDAPIGTYYAFYYDPGSDSYGANFAADQAKFIVSGTTMCCNKPNDPLVQVKILSATGHIPQYGQTYDLTQNLDLANYTLPPNAVIKWYTNANHSGTPVADPTKVTEGEYYAVAHDATNGCFNTNLSTAKVTVSVDCYAGNSQVHFKNGVRVTTNSCPAQTVNLNSLIQTALPPNCLFLWFTNDQHAGQPVNDPTQVLVSGSNATYYAFIFDPGHDCFNMDKSTAKMSVMPTVCNAPVSLNLNVALQGAMQGSAGSSMRNDLQKYFGSYGLLPVNDPYGSAATYPEINNTSVKAGNVVDWVKVEIRSSANPSVVLQSKSLLLRTDGAVLGMDGLPPTFDLQSSPVRIVVKHRSHLPVMSIPITSFTGSKSYNLTSELNQAFNDGSAPAQMILLGSKWCMRAADIASPQDHIVDGVDGTQFTNAFNAGAYDAYTPADLNMDGAVDGVDGTLFNNSFNAGYFSILLNYF